MRCGGALWFRYLIFITQTLEHVALGFGVDSSVQIGGSSLRVRCAPVAKRGSLNSRRFAALRSRKWQQSARGGTARAAVGTRPSSQSALPH